MGESLVGLVRSLSQPASNSNEPGKADPLSALTTSISFGRFMSESLAWEKWSSFSHNRYLEEAEKFSKPGSVAEKKAHFEAHYKRIAAKKAAALLEQQNTASNDLPEPNIVDGTHNNSSTVSELSKSDSQEVIDEMQGKEDPNTELVMSVDANVCNLNVERNTVETEQLVIAENSVQVELSNQHENVEKQSKIISTQQEKMLIMDAAKLGNLASTSKKKQSTGSPKSCTYSGASKLRSSVKLSSVQPSKEDSATRTSKKTARESVDRKRSTPKSLHMSINFPSRAGEKTSSPILQKIGNSKIIRTFVKTSKDSLVIPRRTPTRASVSGLPVHPLATPQPQNRRTKILGDQLVSGSRTADVQSQSLSVNRAESSGVSGHKAQSPILASSFSFRCEERAAKRKEFFRKLEEKLNEKEPEKVQLHAKSKEKADDDFKKMRRSIGFNAKPIANFHGETASLSNHMKKIPLTRPRSPKLGRKPIPSIVQDIGSRPPRRPSIYGSKHVIEKRIQTPTRPINSLLRKSMLENASPNIPL